MTRKLVTIRRIKDKADIPGADLIELIFVDGWQVVAQKAANHKVGDLVLYYEIDSFLPETDPRYASFSERFTNWGDKRGMRLKTIKLRKQLSQGLVMPLREFPEAVKVVEVEGNIVLKDAEGKFNSTESWENIDVTEALGIEKWEPIENSYPARVPGSSDGKRFPAFIRKTDQERVQNYGALVERALEEEFEVTMKKDGSSMTVFRVDPESPHYNDARNMTRKKLSLWGRVKEWVADRLAGREAIYGICSRNVLLTMDGDSNFHRAVKKYGLLDSLEILDGSYALQGEVVAPDIQDNYEKVQEVEFHLFDIFDIDKQVYVLPKERHAMAHAAFIPHTTVLEVGVLSEVLGYGGSVTDVVKLALEYAEGPGDNIPAREGVVFKSTKRDFSFKAVSNSYLLKTGK